MDKYIDIVFDGPPDHDSGRFVEVEDHTGKSMRFGEWVHRQDGFWCLRIGSSEHAESALAEKDRRIAELEAGLGVANEILENADHTTVFSPIEIPDDDDARFVPLCSYNAMRHERDTFRARLAAVKEAWSRARRICLAYDAKIWRTGVTDDDSLVIDAALSGSRALAVVEGRIHTITGDDVSVVADLPGQIGSYPRTVTVVVLDASGKE